MEEYYKDLLKIFEAYLLRAKTLRASGTEPLIRIYVEMPSQEKVDMVLREAVKLFE